MILATFQSYGKFKMRMFLTAAVTLSVALAGMATSVNADDTATMKPTTEQTIVEVAAGNKSFSTLVAAVKAGGLVETLSGDGPFTVFAPTDEAFAALPDGTVEMLVQPENKDKLVKILTYHVVAGEVMASDVVKLSEAKTVQGSMVDIEVNNGTVMIDKAKVIKADIDCENGVIHVIDKVLMPE